MSQNAVICPGCRKPVTITSSIESGNQTGKYYSCGDSSVNIVIREETPSLKLRTKDQTNKELVEAKILESPRTHLQVERLYLKVPTVLQVVFEGGKIVHLDCKGCGNQWKLEEDTGWDDRFEVEEVSPRMFRFMCRKCGVEHDSSH